jgi:hypothetical protein
MDVMFTPSGGDKGGRVGAPAPPKWLRKKNYRYFKKNYSKKKKKKMLMLASSPLPAPPTDSKRKKKKITFTWKNQPSKKIL